MARHRKRRSFSRKRRGFVGKKRNSRRSRKKIINRYTVSRGGIRL